MAKFVVTINQEECIGCGSCEAVCPAVFEMRDDGKAHVKQKQTDKPCAKEAAETCPVDVVKLK